MRGLFVTATDTGVGKPVLSAVTPGRVDATGSAATPFDADVDLALADPSVPSESSAPFDFEAELDSVRAA